MDILNTKIKSILTEKNTKIKPENIKKDVNILGITGNLEVLDTSDANAEPINIRKDKTAYVNGQKITGTLPVLTYPINPDNPSDFDYQFIEASSAKKVTRNNTIYIMGAYQIAASNDPDSWMFEGNRKMKLGIAQSKVATAISLKGEQIKKGEKILGVTGTYKGQQPSGEIEITENGTVDVSQYASANVNVSSGGDVSEYFNDTIGGGSGSGNNAIPGFALALKKVPPGLVAGTYASYMFYRCTSLEEVTNLDTSNTTNMSHMFRNCSKLHKIANLDTSKCTNFSYMFNGCSALETIPLINTSNGTSVSQMFTSSGITTIPLLDFSSATSLLSMFQYCTKLESVPLLNISHITTLMNTFSGCTKLTELPEFNTSNLRDMSSMCYNCQALTTVPQFITSNVTNMQSAFASCPNLSNESLNNILAMCTNVSASYSKTKTLKDVGLTSAQTTTCQSLSNWDDFVSAGWTSGY